jgi:amino acid transporter
MNDGGGLRANCLNFWEVLAQSIAMLGPTMTPVLIVPLVFASSGNAGWLAYVFGTIMLLFVALNLREFARRSATAGSLYTYAQRAFGARGSMLAGVCLLWAYAFVCVAGLTGFAVFGRALLGPLGTHVPDIVLSALCLGIGWYVSYIDIRISTITLLALETASVGLIVVLTVISLAHAGTVVDPVQLSLKGASLPAIGLGAVLAIFSLVGFESATSLGEEAHDPLRTIPAAVIWSVIISGAFFVLCVYAQTFVTRGHVPPLDKLTTPLDTIAQIAGVPWLRIPIDVGALFSSFSVALASLNAGALVLFTTGRSNLLPESLGRSHHEHKSPYVALGVFALINLAVTGVLYLCGRSASDAFGDTATLGSFGFIAIYFAISAGAPVYLHRTGELRPSHVVVSAIAVICLLVPAVDSVYPPQPFPATWYPLYFAIYFVVGAAWLWSRSARARIIEPDLSHAPAAE